MALPRKLKHLNIFNAGNNWMGIAESVTLPKFTRKLENYRGGGMPGSVGIDLGLDDGALDTEMTIGGTEALLFKQMGKATVDGVQLRFTGLFSVTTPAKFRPLSWSSVGATKRWIPASGKPARAIPPRSAALTVTRS